MRNKKVLIGGSLFILIGIALYVLYSQKSDLKEDLILVQELNEYSARSKKNKKIVPNKKNYQSKLNGNAKNNSEKKRKVIYDNFSLKPAPYEKLNEKSKQIIFEMLDFLLNGNCKEYARQMKVVGRNKLRKIRKDQYYHSYFSYFLMSESSEEVINKMGSEKIDFDDDSYFRDLYQCMQRTELLLYKKSKDMIAIEVSRHIEDYMEGNADTEETISDCNGLREEILRNARMLLKHRIKLCQDFLGVSRHDVTSQLCQAGHHLSCRLFKFNTEDL